MSSIASLISASKKVKDETCPCQSDYVGFAHLSEQVHRKLNKRGFQFTLMVVGERGLGKTTLIQSLFGIPQLDKIKTSPLNNIHIRASTVDVEELGVRVRLTIISTPGYGDCIDETHTKNVLIDYIDQQFQRYFNDEYGFDRQMIVDQRVHCLLYLLSSSNRSLKPLEIDCMKALQSRVNLIPIIAKADGLTMNERHQLKLTILEQIVQQKIEIYRIPECDPEDDEHSQEINRRLKNSFPLAICSSNEFLTIDGKMVRARIYPWGWINCENSMHSDLSKLRTMLITHMHDLQQYTHQVHYERFRLKNLKLNA